MHVKFYNMENKIKDTTEKLENGTITKDEADKILLDLFGVGCSNEQEEPLKLTWLQELVGAFKNRRY